MICEFIVYKFNDEFNTAYLPHKCNKTIVEFLSSIVLSRDDHESLEI